MSGPVSFPHYSTGPTLVSWPSQTSNLGYADDRIMIEERPFYEDIRNDGFGGAAGMPSDVQYLGSIAIVTINLNRFNEPNVRTLANLDSGDDGDEGVMPAVGSFVRQDSLHGELALRNKEESRIYSYAFLRQGRRFNVGVRHQVISLVFECHINDPCDMILFTVGSANDPCNSSGA